MIEKIRQELAIDDQGNTVVIHPETSSDNVLHMGSTLDKMITLGGVPQTSFDLVEGKVVQDGLVEILNTPIKITSRYDVDVDFLTCKTLVIKTSLKRGANNDHLVLYHIGANAGKYISHHNYKPYMFYKHFSTEKTLTKEEFEKENIYTFIFDNSKTELYINDIYYGYLNHTENLNTFNFISFCYNTNLCAEANLAFVGWYNRQLTPQEMAHNLQVLNNSPSITKLITTNADSTKKEFVWGADADHVIMPGGKTLRQFGNECLDWEEIPSTDGSPIEVANVKEAWIRNAEIRGRTVKCYATFQEQVGVTRGSGNKDVLTIDAIPEVTQGLQYRLVIQAENVVGTNMFSLLDRSGSQIAFSSNAVKDGINVFDLTCNRTITPYKLYLNGSSSADASCKVVFANVIDVGSSIDVAIPLGLSSAKACIEVNGETTYFYEPIITGTVEGLAPSVITDPPLPTLSVGDILDLAKKTITFADGTKRTLISKELEAYSIHKKVICLPFAEDKLTLNEDGSQTWIDASSELIINSASIFGGDVVNSFPNVTDKNNVSVWLCSSSIVNDALVPQVIMVNNMEAVGDGYSQFTKPGQISIYNSNKYIAITTSKLTKDQLEQELSNNPIVVKYKVASPTSIHIQKGVNGTIPLQQNNILLSAGKEVKPSSFKATVPVDRISELDARLKALENVTIANTLK